jgi:DNA-binding transcriptional regulator YbjK
MKRVRISVIAAALCALLLASCATSVDKAEKLYKQYIEAKMEGDVKKAEKLWDEYQDIRQQLSEEEIKELDTRVFDVLR